MKDATSWLQHRSTAMMTIKVLGVDHVGLESTVITLGVRSLLSEWYFTTAYLSDGALSTSWHNSRTLGMYTKDEPTSSRGVEGK